MTAASGRSTVKILWLLCLCLRVYICVVRYAYMCRVLLSILKTSEVILTLSIMLQTKEKSRVGAYVVYVFIR